MEKDSVSVFAEPIWAIVELMGRNVTAGLVQSVPVAGTEMLRVDVPSVDDFEGYTKFYGGTAIYAITPTDEESAMHVISCIQPRAISEWTVPVKIINHADRQLLLEEQRDYFEAILEEGLLDDDDEDTFEDAYLIGPDGILDDDEEEDGEVDTEDDFPF